MMDCPWEGCSFESSDLGVKQHHKRTHSESLCLVEDVCEQCGAGYTRQQSNKDGGSYCSGECYHKSDRERVTLDCDECDSTFEKWPSQISEDNNFCSHQCRGKFVRANPNTECSFCGEEIHKPPSRIDKYENVYCSHECANENRRGDGSIHWKEGVYSLYTGGWGTHRREALERDQYRCRECGMSDAAHHNTYDRQLEVHHITPLRTFDDPADAHYLDNLLTVCKECHMQIENETPKA